MNFIDTVKVDVIAGDGGNGATSFRHEKFVDRGGPDGGDGGNGGSVILVASRNENTLASFRYQKELKAKNGGNGAKQRKHGKNGADLFVNVPVGTVVNDAEGQSLADLADDGQKVIIAAGGRGGFGNAHFVSSVRQAPRFAEKGEPGQTLSPTLELKLIADVGLVGLPNAGKSTFLGKVTSARPEISDYPFTTLKPNLGVVDIDKTTSFLIADIPGLIEGAAGGKGLGHEFLRHIERTKVLLHIIDAYQDDITVAFQTINNELKSYKIDLSERPQIVAINKVDGLDEDISADLLKQLRKAAPRGTNLHAISAQSGHGIKSLLYDVKQQVEAEQQKQAVVSEAASDELPVLRLADSELPWKVSKVSKDKKGKNGDGQNQGRFIVSGQRIEKFAARTDFANEQGVQRLRNIMQKMGIVHELKRQDVKADDTVVIGSGEFPY